MFLLTHRSILMSASRQLVQLHEKSGVFQSSSVVLRSLTTVLSNDNNNVNCFNSSKNLPDYRQTFHLTSTRRRFLSISAPKIRQHVNPLQSTYQQPLILPAHWVVDRFQNPQQPFVIDVGSAEGRFTLKFAAENPEINVLGLEIRRPMVDHCNFLTERQQLQNCHFMASNANIDLHNIIDSLNAAHNIIKMILIQFPDPHFKKRNHKRRLVNFQLVRDLASRLHEGTMVLLQSDVEDLAQDMVFRLGSTPWFSPATGYSAQTLTSNPSPNNVLTDRERRTLAKNQPVFRMLYTRNSVAYDGTWKEPCRDVESDEVKKTP
jgi:tRNA (guanine-N7-)-methyltransferase